MTWMGTLKNIQDMDLGFALKFIEVVSQNFHQRIWHNLLGLRHLCKFRSERPGNVLVSIGQLNLLRIVERQARTKGKVSKWVQLCQGNICALYPITLLDDFFPWIF